MDTALIIALIGATVSIFGWLINYVFATISERNKQKLTSKLEFTQRQLEELYGPLVFLVLEGRRSYNDLLEALGRNFVFFENKPLSEKDLEIWLFWTENDFFPRNEKIKYIIEGKTHLIDNEKVPESWLAFLNHHNSWKIGHLRWEKMGNKYDWHSKVNWPIEFEDDVIKTFNAIKLRHSKLIGRIL